MQLGKKLLSGNLNLINVSMPVKLFEPRSYLEKMTDVWVYPGYLRLAAGAPNPVQRMEHVMTWSAPPLTVVMYSNISSSETHHLPH